MLADLARAIQDAARTELPPIERVDRGGRLPLSFAQQRLWFLEQMGELGQARTTSPGGCGWEASWTGRRCGARWTRSSRATRRCARRSWRWRASRCSGSRRRAGSTSWSTTSAGTPDAEAELRRLAAEEADAPFDLEHGPLIRGRLVRLAADDHVLLLTMHHIVSDGWSAGVLARELGTLYAAFRAWRGRSASAAPGAVRGLRGLAAEVGGWRGAAGAGGVLEGDARRRARAAGAARRPPAPRPAEPCRGATVGVDWTRS